MTEPTLSMHLRTIQESLRETNDDLIVAMTLAHSIGLVPHHIAGLQAALNDNEHAWRELNTIATALELTAADHKL